MTQLDLCELATVKLRLGIDDTDKDTLLSGLISAVSRALEEHCNRSFFTEERTEYATVTNPEVPIILRAYPVTAIASIKNSPGWDWTTTDALDADDYDTDTEAGIVYFQSRLSRGPRALQVVYTAGIGTTAAEVASAFPDIASAAEMQVVEEYLRRDAQGPVTYSLSEGGGTGQTQALKLLPAVVQRLQHHRRWTL